LWILAYALATLPFLLAFGRFERGDASAVPYPAPLNMQLVGCAVSCLGLAMLALDGIGGSGWLGLRWVPLALPLLGSGMAGFGPFGRIGRLLGRH